MDCSAAARAPGARAGRWLRCLAACGLLLCACDGAILGGGSGSAGDPGPGGAGAGGSGAPGPGTSDAGLGDPEQQVQDGRQRWSQLCAGCHGDFLPGTALSTGNANGDFRLDVNAALERHGAGLEAYIDTTMPMGTPTLCTGDCATALGAYLRSLVVPAAPECMAGVGPAAGDKQVMLLTSREYQNSLQDLLGAAPGFGARVENNDGRRGGFVDMRGQSISSTLLDTYRRNAETIATWAVNNGRPFACDDATACADRFVDEFLFEAFRGQVSDDQKAAYRKLFSDYPAEGLQLALKAALSSPLFLYRVEVGLDVEAARSAGHYSGVVEAGETPVPTGDVAETRTAAQFSPQSNGRLEGDVWGLFENGRIVVGLSTAFSGPTVVEVVARGSNFGDVWPELTLRVNGTVVGVRRVDSAELRAYSFDVTGVTGVANVEVAFENDAGQEPYGPGMDANLFVQEVRLLGTETPGANPTPPSGGGGSGSAVSLLDEAPAGAAVLSPLELASTLAFRLTGSTPDRALLQAARDGRLGTRDGIRAQVERLIDSDRGRARVGEFVTRWFRIDEIDQALRPDVPELTDEVKAAMLQEVRAHFLHVFYDESAPYSEFFGGDYTFLNATLAEFYGIEGQFDDSFRMTTVERRGGPLASGAFMTVNAHADRTAPILRAVRARQTALCHYIDPPNSPIAGDDIDAQRAAAQARVAEKESQAGVLSSRDFYFLYTDGIDACAGCHERIINPMFGMEDFDHVGRLRPVADSGHVIETVHGKQVEVSTEGMLLGVASTSDAEEIAYAGAKDLSNQLADTDAIHQCLARKAFRFVTGATYVDRDLDAAYQEQLTAAQRDSYSCVADDMLRAFEQGGMSPRAMFVQLATDSLLLFRR